MGQQHTRSGFVGIIVTLVVAVVAIVAVGLTLYQYQKTKPLASSSTSYTSQSTSQQKGASAQLAQAVTQYLVIKEWGVKLPLSDSIKNAYYVVEKGSSYGLSALPSTVWLGVASYSNAVCNPANNNAGGRGAIGAILRVLPTDKDPVKGQLLTQEYPNGVTIGGWYYAYQSWAVSNPCASESTLQPVDSAFATAAKGIATATSN
jgi:hypothetical protein